MGLKGPTYQFIADALVNGDEREAEKHNEDGDLKAELLKLPLDRVGEHQLVEQLSRVVVVETRLQIELLVHSELLFYQCTHTNSCVNVGTRVSRRRTRARRARKAASRTRGV